MKRLLLCLLTCPLFLAAPAGAAGAPHVSAEVVAETPSEDGFFWAAVRLVPEEGWHVYWKNPGDSGLATEVAWRLPEGMKPAGEARWPSPHAFVDQGIVNYGYAGETYIFVPLRAERPLKKGDVLSADVAWLACREICVPGKARAAVEAPFPAPPASFFEARARLPLPASSREVAGRDAGDALVLRFAPGKSGFPADARFYSEDPSLVNHSAPQKWSPVPGGYELVVPKAEPGTPAPASARGVVVADGGWDGPGSPEGLEVELDLRKETP